MLDHISLLKNEIQKYAWGSKTAIPELIGQKPDGHPQAELWMGAHPGAPSEVFVQGRWTPLDRVIKSDPVTILGKVTAEKFNNELPFLLKVLAAGRPLSIQAHPDPTQAKKGFERENAEGVPLTSGRRNYRDGNHKPECICAISPFWALNGFRTIRETLFHLERLCPDELGEEIAGLKKQQNAMALKTFFGGILGKPEQSVARIIKEVYKNAKASNSGDDPVSSWIIRLHNAYPGDIGILSPAFLNLVHLEPGEALYLTAGRLHAYLEGVGMELMANSDNVLRGGLTPKHVDVPELLKVLTFEETVPEILNPVLKSPGVRQYITPAEEFVLSEIKVDGNMGFDNRNDNGVEIMFCRHGEVTATDGTEAGTLILSKGMSMIVPAFVAGYTLEGKGLLYRAST